MNAEHASISDKQKAEAACRYITGRMAENRNKRLTPPPAAGILTGTGLAEAVAGLKVSATIPYSDIPHFPPPTAPGHHGRLICGALAGKPILAMQGRFHLYEGYTPVQVAFPIRVMQTLGAKTVILLNAAGGLNSSFETGDIMAITDHINLTGRNPLVGPNEAAWGVRFPDMCAVYDTGLIRRAQAAAAQQGSRFQKGVYAGLLGPSLETPAEIRFLKTIGADAVGLSTVLEAIAAAHGGLRILGLSLITNTHDPDQPQPATLEDVLQVAESAAPKLAGLIAGVLEGNHAA